MRSLYLACGLTMAVETLYFFLCGFRRREFVLLCLAANLATNLSLNLFVQYSSAGLLTILLLELLAVLVEYAVYSLALGGSGRLLLHTFFANVLSVSVGGALLRLLLYTGVSVLLIPVCLAFARLYIRMQQKKHLISALILKALASLCFVAFALLCAAGTRSAVPFVLGLSCGCAADVLLGLRTIFRRQRKLLFLMGGLVFLGGHSLYLAGTWPTVENKPLCAALSLVLTGILLWALFSRVKADRVIKGFGIVYFGTLVLLNTAAWGNALTAPGVFSVCFAVGTLLFLASDMILNLYTFGPKLPFCCRVLYSMLYYTGQLLIALSLRFL